MPLADSLKQYEFFSKLAFESFRLRDLSTAASLVDALNSDAVLEMHVLWCTLPGHVITRYSFENSEVSQSVTLLPTHSATDYLAIYGKCCGTTLSTDLLMFPNFTRLISFLRAIGPILVSSKKESAKESPSPFWSFLRRGRNPSFWFSDLGFNQFPEKEKAETILLDSLEYPEGVGVGVKLERALAVFDVLRRFGAFGVRRGTGAISIMNSDPPSKDCLRRLLEGPLRSVAHILPRLFESDPLVIHPLVPETDSRGPRKLRKKKVEDPLFNKEEKSKIPRKRRSFVDLEIRKVKKDSKKVFSLDDHYRISASQPPMSEFREPK